MRVRGNEARVLVTGGSGYLAGWMIVRLLQQGYRVRTTLRSLAKEPEVRAKIAKEIEAADRLSFCQADLTRDEGWSDAVRECEYVVHVASPMGQGLPQSADLLGPARDGSLRVLHAAGSSGVKRVVVTSSVVASLPSDDADTADESTWTDVAAKNVDNYTRSKTLAERAVWDFVERARPSGSLTISTILPGMVLGPVMGNHVSGSVELIARLLSGRVPAIPRIGFAIVDVRDLVELHLEAMLAPAAANERFVAAHEFLWMSEIAAVLRARLGARAARVPTRAMPDFVVRLAALVQADARFLAPRLGVKHQFSNAKAATLLDWHPRPARETVLDTAASLLTESLA